MSCSLLCECIYCSSVMFVGLSILLSCCLVSLRELYVKDLRTQFLTMKKDQQQIIKQNGKINILQQETNNKDKPKNKSKHSSQTQLVENQRLELKNEHYQQSLSHLSDYREFQNQWSCWLSGSSSSSSIFHLLSIIRCCPYLVSFTSRCEFFRSLCQNQLINQSQHSMPEVTIRRSHILEDGIKG